MEIKSVTNIIINLSDAENSKLSDLLIKIKKSLINVKENLKPEDDMKHLEGATNLIEVILEKLEQNTIIISKYDAKLLSYILLNPFMIEDVKQKEFREFVYKVLTVGV